MKEYRMNLSAAINDAYTPYAYVMLHSLFEKNPEAEVYVYLLQYDLRDESRNKLERLTEEFENHLVLLPIDTGRLSEKLPRTMEWPVEVYFRLLLPDLLPEEVDRILYLDADIIVNQNLRSFYESDFAGKLILGCRDLALKNLTTEQCLEKRSEKLRPLFEKHRYINSGVLLFHMEELRKKYHFRDYLDLAEELDYQIFSPDQDLINYLHRDEIGHVDEWKYNFLTWIGANNGYDYERTKQEVVILHYAGQGPWKGGNHVHYSLERFWWEQAVKTPYAKELAEGFALDAVTDQTIISYIGALEQQKAVLENENGQLKDALNQAMSIIEKFMGKQ